MTDAEAKQKWTGENHLERWRTLYGQWVMSGTEAHGTVYLEVNLEGLTPFQQDVLMHNYAHHACMVERKPVNVMFL
jgi:hypothetical protein